MHTTSGLLTLLGQRLAAVGFLGLVLLALVVALAAGLVLFVVSDVVAAADPVQVAPVRWVRHA